MSVRIRWRNLELPLRVRLDQDTFTDTYGRFSAEPFQRGYGNTIGNVLRRVLLTSLEGAGVCSFRVKGLKAGSESVPHLTENVERLALNVKKLRVRLTDETAGEVMLKSEIDGKETLLGGDLSNGSAEILNPDLVLGRIPDKGKLGLEVRVRKGRGYRVVSELEIPDLASNEVPIDAFYSPVRRVEYRVESTRVGKMTNYDKLIIQIWTNGVITPDVALAEAGKLLQKHLNPFVQLADLGPEIPVEEADRTQIDEGASVDSGESEALNVPISALDLSVRAYNCIVSANIHTVGELVSRTEAELLKIRNFGKTSLREIRKKLGDLGLAFAGQPEEDVDDDDDDFDSDDFDDFDGEDDFEASADSSAEGDDEGDEAPVPPKEN